MPTTKENNDPIEVRQQNARALLRESFARAIFELRGKKCHVITYEKTTVRAKFGGWHPAGTDMPVRDLETPTKQKMEKAFLRTKDVLVVRFNEPVELP